MKGHPQTQKDEGEVRQDCWSDCYKGSWAGLICPDAFAHPAKFSRSLIQRIYQHAREEGWLVPGATCLDPFGGVSLGGIDAALMGVQHVAVELEERFHQLALANVALWEQRYGPLPQWVRPVCLHGDSRALQDVLQQAGYTCVVSSPPYAESKTRDGVEMARVPIGTRWQNGERVRDDGSEHGYGTSPAQLGNLPPGSVDGLLDCTVSSPPYARSLHGQDDALDVSARMARTSPPRTTGGPTGHNSQMNHPRAYGTTPGNLATLPAGLPSGAVDLCASSPPWENNIAFQDASFVKEDRRPGREGTQWGQYVIGHTHSGQDYGTSPAQLGNTQADTFWSASRTILEQVYAVLKPGAAAIFVTKRYIRNSQLVEFSQDWARLCQAVGFEWVHHHKALLVEEHGTQHTLFGDTPDRITTERKSFFRRLAERKNSPRIDWEDVLCFRKPLSAAPLPPDAAWQQLPLVDCTVASPPFGVGDSAGPESLHRRTDASAQNMLKAQGWPGGGQVSPGNLGALPAGRVEAALDLAISSPPYVHSVHDGNGIDQAKFTGNTPGKHTQAVAEGYGRTKGQLGTMREGRKP